MSLGLDDVVVAQTQLSHVDGAAGRLIVRGHELAEIARWRFEDVLALLWGRLGGGVALLGEARVRAFALLRRAPRDVGAASAVEEVRTLLSLLDDAETLPHHVLAVGAMGVFVAAVGRRRAGGELVAPDPALSHVEDVLRMLRGVPAPGEHARALETYLNTVADHGLNASTFAARVIASTDTGVFSPVLGALCALKGRRHGGAPGPVLDMLDAIGTDAKADAWLGAALDRGEKLMGFGHRVYRVRDPRADVLRDVVRSLRGDDNRIVFAEQVEAAALRLLAARKPTRRLDTNVEFFTALLLEALAIPRDLFTPTFAVGRVAGWTAHVLEQMDGGRLIRPQSRYIGPSAPSASA
jgi:citrate synthase